VDLAIIAAMIFTMPWICLRAAIEQILQEPDIGKQETQLNEWKRLKNAELMNVSFAGTLVASAVTGSIQWIPQSTAHWIVYAAWYGTLLFSLVSVMIAFYLSILLSNFAINPFGNTLLLRVLHSPKNADKSRWISMFALQIPVTLLSYALMLYIFGLSFLVIQPLWNDPWGHSSLIAIIYSVFLFAAAVGYITICFFICVQNREVLKFD